MPREKQQSEKHVPQRNPDNPYVAVPLSERDQEILGLLSKGECRPGLLAAIDTLFQRARSIYADEGSAREVEFTIEEISPDTWEVTLRQDRPER